MDLLLINNILKKNKPNSEKFEDEKSNSDNVKEEVSSTETIIGIIAFIAFGIAAVYFSWVSNTVCEWNVGFKIIYAIFAFLFGLSYVIIYVINRMDAIWMIKSKNKIIQSRFANYRPRTNIPITNAPRTNAPRTNAPRMM